MRYAFVAEHREQFSVRTMCQCLGIHPSGFYGWLKSPLSKRAGEDIRQTRLIEDAWKQSGKVMAIASCMIMNRRRDSTPIGSVNH